MQDTSPVLLHVPKNPGLAANTPLHYMGTRSTAHTLLLSRALDSLEQMNDPKYNTMQWEINLSRITAVTGRFGKALMLEMCCHTWGAESTARPQLWDG